MIAFSLIFFHLASWASVNASTTADYAGCGEVTVSKQEMNIQLPTNSCFLLRVDQELKNSFLQVQHRDQEIRLHQKDLPGMSWQAPSRDNGRELVDLSSLQYPVVLVLRSKRRNGAPGSARIGLLEGMQPLEHETLLSFSRAGQLTASDAELDRQSAVEIYESLLSQTQLSRSNQYWAKLHLACLKTDMGLAKEVLQLLEAANDWWPNDPIMRLSAESLYAYALMQDRQLDRAHSHFKQLKTKIDKLKAGARPPGLAIETRRVANNSCLLRLYQLSLIHI